MNYQINQNHIDEWIASGVDGDLIELNVISLFNDEPYDRLLYGLPTAERRNDGRLRDKWLRRYAHLDKGGWWCSGVDVLTGEDSQWGQLKPNQPYRYVELGNNGKIKNKIIKYEGALKVPTEIIALRVSFLHSWNIVRRQNEKARDAWIERFQKIAEQVSPKLQEACRKQKYRAIDRILHGIWNKRNNRAEYNVRSDKGGIERLVKSVDIGFWKWVINSDVSLTITEGAKKAGALLTAGYVAIALPGIYSGYRQKKDEYGIKISLPYLIPQLQVFAEKNREIAFCFDNDNKLKTVKNVRKAIAKTGKLFVREGCRVSVVKWDFPEKGVDDLIVARGVECFRQLYKDRLNLSKYNLASLLDLSRYNALKINERFLDEKLVPPENAQIIALRSPKGTGKTEWLTGVVQQAIAMGKPVLVITHRIQLAKALCDRFGIDHIEEVRNSTTKGVLGYGLCIDSLHPNSQARFNPEDWNEAIVILDEAEQVIWHLLDSSTCFGNRITIIDNLKQLLKIVVSSGGKIYLSDADLSTISIDYIQKLIELPVETWVAENAYVSLLKRKLITYSGSDPSELVAASVKAIENGEKVLIHTTGQKAKSKWGSINLESFLKNQFPNLRILRIDRDSVSEPNHPAYGCMSNLNNILKYYDIAIASPVIETGVSIDIKGHFDSVWCIAQGVQTVDAVCQTVERLREGVPRHIWIKSTAKGNRIGNGSTSIKGLLASQHKLTTANIRLLQQAGISEFDDLETAFSPESINTWAKRACVVNAGKNDYRNEIIQKLTQEGYEIMMVTTYSSTLIKELVGNIRETNYRQHCQTTSQAESPTDAKLEELTNKKAKTEEERAIERKGILERRYRIKVIPELVERDDNGWYGNLQLHYYLTIGNIFLKERDRRSLDRIKEQGNNRAFKPDINRKQLSAQLKTLELINIQQFLNPDTEFTKHSLADWFQEMVRLRFDIKTVLGVNIHPEQDSAIAVAQRILKKLGLRLEFDRQVRIEGERLRFYKGCSLNPDGRNEVFEQWKKRDSADLVVTPIAKEDI